MKIAYLTADEVNSSLAQQLARSCRIELRVLAPKDPLPSGPCHVLLCDMDSLSPAQPKSLLAHWGPLLQPDRVALHGYSLSAAQEASLRDEGILLFRRLGRGVFRRLRRAIPRNSRRSRVSAESGAGG
jgi:hypothetical protein